MSQPGQTEEPEEGEGQDKGGWRLEIYLEIFLTVKRYSQALLSLVELKFYCALIGRELSYAIRNQLKTPKAHY